MEQRKNNYKKIYRCPRCNVALAGKNENEEIENLPQGKMKIGYKIITISCSKCGGVKVLYLKK